MRSRRFPSPWHADKIPGGSTIGYCRRERFPPGEVQMRQIAIFAAFVLSALAAKVLPSSAQSPYDYPWCSRQLGFGGPTSCYFASYQQCLTTVRGIGGYCYQNPAYRGAARRRR